MRHKSKAHEHYIQSRARRLPCIPGPNRLLVQPLIEDWFSHWGSTSLHPTRPNITSYTNPLKRKERLRDVASKGLAHLRNLYIVWA